MRTATAHRRRRAARACGPALLLIVSIMTSAAAAQPSRAPSSAVKPTQVLFMCPHGAAKSVLASAYFQQLAKERGLNVRVESAGTEPDPVVDARIVEHLTKNGYAVPISKPRMVTPDDLATADVVISLGCDMSKMPRTRGELRQWDDVPAPSEDLGRADEVIRRRVIELVDELVRRPK